MGLSGYLQITVPNTTVALKQKQYPMRTHGIWENRSRQAEAEIVQGLSSATVMDNPVKSIQIAVTKCMQTCIHRSVLRVGLKTKPELRNVLWATVPMETAPRAAA